MCTGLTMQLYVAQMIDQQRNLCDNLTVSHGRQTALSFFNMFTASCEEHKHTEITIRFPFKWTHTWLHWHIDAKKIITLFIEKQTRYINEKNLILQGYTNNFLFFCFSLFFEWGSWIIPCRKCIISRFSPTHEHLQIRHTRKYCKLVKLSNVTQTWEQGTYNIK